MTNEARFNPFHAPAGSSTGGEFTSGGGGGSGGGSKPAPAPHKGHAPAHGHQKGHGSGRHGSGHIASTLAYDPKTNRGPGYGNKSGSPEVKDLQAALNRLGLTDTHGRKLAVDGKLGPLTTSSIKAAQRRLGLKADGHVTPELYTKLLGLKSLSKQHRAEMSDAEWRAWVDAQSTGVLTMTYSERAQMSAADINNLPDSDFAYIETGGTKDGEGKTVPRSKRHFPINDADHVRNALARAPQSPFGDKAMPKIMAAAKKFGIHTGDMMSGRSSEETSMTTVERRFTLMTVELRTPPGEQSRIGGYAAMFNKPSQNLGGFVEVVERSFFNKSRGDGWPDVMCRYNHDDNMLLGTTGAGTLRLNLDDTGLEYQVEPPKSRADVVELVSRGDIRKSSFAFRVPSGGEDWGLSDQGYPMRHLVTGALVDVAPVNVPAYLDTTAALRSLAEKMEADPEEVRSLAQQNELRRFFVRTDNRGLPAAKPKPKLLGASAMMQLLERRSDPWE